MSKLLKKFWRVLALVAGLALILFEYRRDHGITSENWFWMLVGALVVILAVIDLVQGPPPPPSQ